MITRKEFLLTADADHAIAAQQAREHTVLEPSFITSNTLTVYVVQKSLYAFLSDQAQTESPLRSICMALMDRLRGVSEFNLSSQLPLGQANRQMLDTLIVGFSTSHPAESEKLSELKAVLESISDRVIHPWPNTTLHDVKIERDACETSDSVKIVGRQAVIELQGDFEPHKPRLLAKNPATGQWQRINNFTNTDNSPCALAGKYACIIPPQFTGWSLEVDDPYQAVV